VWSIRFFGEVGIIYIDNRDQLIKFYQKLTWVGSELTIANDSVVSSEPVKGADYFNRLIPSIRVLLDAAYLLGHEDQATAHALS